MHENDDSQLAIGKRLRHLRKMAGLKLRILAELADVTTTSISLWEHGKSSGVITSKSMGKILQGLNKSGVTATELWLRKGLGEAPKKISREESPHLQRPEVAHKEITEREHNSTLLKLATSKSNEIIHFTSLIEYAVATKLNHSGFTPLLEKDDIVGGVWQPATSFIGGKLCIAKINDLLQVVYLIKGSQEGLFDIIYTLPPQEIATTEGNKDVLLKTIAPIIRIWR